MRCRSDTRRDPNADHPLLQTALAPAVQTFEARPLRGQALDLRARVGEKVRPGIFEGNENRVSALLAIAAPHRIKASHRRRWRVAVGQSVFRDYDASIGRYSQSDPIGLGGGFSTYGYVDQDPLAGIDPKGLARVHGYWCGPNWTGGFGRPWNELTPYEKMRARNPVGQLDQACKQHDRCYGKCGKDYPCDPKMRSLCFRDCDYFLTRDAYYIGGFLGMVVGAAIDRPGERDPGPDAPNCDNCGNGDQP